MLNQANTPIIMLRSARPVKTRRAASMPIERSTKSPTVYSRNSDVGSLSTRSITAACSRQSIRPSTFSIASPSMVWILAMAMAVTARASAQNVS